MESLPPRHSVNKVSQCPMSWNNSGMIKNMTLPLLLEINTKDNYFHISVNCLDFMYRILDKIYFKYVDPTMGD